MNTALLVFARQFNQHNSRVLSLLVRFNDDKLITSSQPTTKYVSVCLNQQSGSSSHCGINMNQQTNITYTQYPGFANLVPNSTLYTNSIVPVTQQPNSIVFVKSVVPPPYALPTRSALPPINFRLPPQPVPPPINIPLPPNVRFCLPPQQAVSLPISIPVSTGLVPPPGNIPLPPDPVLSPENIPLPPGPVPPTVNIHLPSGQVPTPGNIPLPPGPVPPLGNIPFPTVTVPSPGNIPLPPVTVSPPGNIGLPPVTVPPQINISANQNSITQSFGAPQQQSVTKNTVPQPPVVTLDKIRQELQVTNNVLSQKQPDTQHATATEDVAVNIAPKPISQHGFPSPELDTQHQDLSVTETVIYEPNPVTKNDISEQEFLTQSISFQPDIQSSILAQGESAVENIAPTQQVVPQGVAVLGEEIVRRNIPVSHEPFVHSDPYEEFSLYEQIYSSGNKTRELCRTIVDCNQNVVKERVNIPISSSVKSKNRRVRKSKGRGKIPIATLVKSKTRDLRKPLVHCNKNVVKRDKIPIDNLLKRVLTKTASTLKSSGPANKKVKFSKMSNSDRKEESPTTRSSRRSRSASSASSWISISSIDSSAEYVISINSSGSEKSDSPGSSQCKSKETANSTSSRSSSRSGKSGCTENSKSSRSASAKEAESSKSSRGSSPRNGSSGQSRGAENSKSSRSSSTSDADISKSSLRSSPRKGTSRDDKYTESPQRSKRTLSGSSSGSNRPSEKSARYDDRPNAQSGNGNSFRVIDNLGSRPYSGTKPSKTALKFTIASYNILSQDLLENHPYLYSACSQQHRSWEFRSQNLIKEIKQRQPDILCLQEVHHEAYNTLFDPILSAMGYTGVYKKRTMDKQDGCATFWRKRLFEAKEIEKIEYYKPGVDILDRDNIGLVCLLKYKLNKKIVCVANTHLLFNPRRGDVKLAQMMVFFSTIDKMAAAQYTGNIGGRWCEPVYHPTLVCGDFNSEPFSYLYDFITKGWLWYEGLQMVDISGQSENVYRGSWRMMDKRIIPSRVGITDQCQFFEHLCEVYSARLSSFNKSSKSSTIKVPDLSDSNSESRRSRSQSTEDQAQLSSDTQAMHLNNGQSNPNPRDLLNSQSNNAANISIEEGEIRDFEHDKQNHPKDPPKREQSPPKPIPSILDRRRSPPKPLPFYFTYSSGTISHQLNLKSVYQHQHTSENKTHYEVTSQHSNACATFDYIFYSRPKQRESHIGEIRLARVLTLPTTDTFKTVSSLPNSWVSSDHLMLLAEFVWI